MFSDEVAAAMAEYAPDGDMLTAEWRMWWKHMPDYRLVSPFECVAGDWGFTSCDTYAGTLADGTVLELREWDYIWTNEDGHITRWDWFVDPDKWDQLMSLVGLDPERVDGAGVHRQLLAAGRCQELTLQSVRSCDSSESRNEKLYSRQR